MLILNKKNKKLIELYVNDTLDITYKYLVRTLKNNNIEIPKECENKDEYIKTLTLYRKMIKGK